MFNRGTILCIAGLILLAFLSGGLGTFLLFILPGIVRREVVEETRIGFDKTGHYNNMTLKWMSPEYKMSMNIWTFSVGNPDLVSQGDKPTLTEKGPYSFRELQHKEIAFTEGNSRVFYKNSRLYYFDQEASCKNCTLNDKITVPNIVLQKLLDGIKDNFLLRSAFDVIFKETGEKVFVTTSVREFLFDGYADPLISKWCVGVIEPICKAFKVPERIGIFYQKNGTADGKYEIDTGLNSSDLIGKVYSFNDKKVVDAWYGPYAKMINGTDGQLFAPGLDRRDSRILQLFIGQICRTIELEYSVKSSYQDVPVYLYHPAKSMNNVDLQRQLGFCNPKTPIFFNNTYIQQEGCLPSGVMDMSSCLPGNLNIYMSQPHFYNSHPALREALVGLHDPSQEEDETVIGIEPTSGVVVFAQQRTQISLAVMNGNLATLKKLSSRIVPIIWFNESVSFDSATRDQLLELSHIRSRTFIGGIAAYLILFSSIFGLVALFVVRRLRSQPEGFEHRLLFSDEEEQEQNNFPSSGDE